MSFYMFDKIKGLLQELEYRFEDDQDDINASARELQQCQEDIIRLGNENDKLRTDVELLTSELEEASEALRRFGVLHG